MKLTGILIFIASLHVSARGLTQTITLSVKDAPLEEVFKLIEKQTDYVFLFERDLITKSKRVTITVSKPLLEVLDLCFKDQPFTYHITGKIIALAPRRDKPEKENKVSIDGQNALIDLKGRVVNSDGAPITGATVSVMSTKKSTVTDGNGNFFLSGVDEKATVIITHVQYEMKSFVLNGRNMLNATLQVKVNSLDELQVIAYGTTSKRYNTGNVATVKSTDIEKQPVNNPLLALSGRVAGLTITQASGFAGSGVKVRIQGVNSIAGGNDPLYVIDGVPYISQLPPAISTTLGSSGGLFDNSGVAYGNPMSFINPADIESIEVLKDADATAIYGSKAANGAILITTKNGKPGEQKIEFNLQQGWGRVTRKMDMLNLRQFLDMRYEALKNDGINLNAALPTDAAFYDLKVWDTTRSTNWQKELIGNTSHYTDLQSSISGGNNNTSFSIGLGYHRETTVLPADFNDARGSLHFQINSNSTDQKFRMHFSGSFMSDVNKLPHNVDGGDVSRMAFLLAPDAPAVYNADGSINWALDANGKSTWDYPGNPMAQLLNKYNNKTSNLIGNLLLSYQLLPGLQIKSSFGYTNLVTNETVVVPLASTAPEARSNTTRIGVYGNSTIHSWIIEPQLSYKQDIFNGKLETLIGSTFQDRQSDGQRFHGFGYATDDVIDDIHAAASVVTDPGIRFTYKYNAVFARVNYIWNKKYIINLTARKDGSSRFGDRNKFHNFWSASWAWIFSEEQFFKEYFPILSFGKIKASYGTTGSDQIGDYRYISTFGPATVGVPYQGITTLAANGIANPYLQWEETKKLSVGLNLGFWNDRLLFDVNYFCNRSSNQLLTYQLPITTGFNGITQNFPATVQNTGLEVAVNSINFIANSFKWSTAFNLTIPKNKLVAFPGLESSSYANYLVIGEPITMVKRFHLIGVDPATGVYYFNSKVNPFRPQTPDDANVIINTSPEFYGGIQNSFTYKNFQLDFLLQFTKQKGPNYSYGWFPGVARYNQPVYLLDRWQKPGDITSHQRYNADFSISSAWLNAATNSDASYEDASYIRLKNISLSWQMPKQLLKAAHLHGIRIFTQAQNLLTITKYKGLDPETLSAYSLPPLRVVTMGAQVIL